MGNYSNDIRCMNLCMGLVKHVPHSRQKMVPLMVSNLYYSPTKGPYFLNEPYQRSLFFKRALPKVWKCQYVSALPKVNFSGPSLSITRKPGRVPPPGPLLEKMSPPLGSVHYLSVPPPAKKVGGVFENFDPKKGGSSKISMRKKGGSSKISTRISTMCQSKKINLLYIHIYTI